MLMCRNLDRKVLSPTADGHCFVWRMLVYCTSHSNYKSYPSNGKQTESFNPFGLGLSVYLRAIYFFFADVAHPTR